MDIPDFVYIVTNIKYTGEVKKNRLDVKNDKLHRWRKNMYWMLDVSENTLVTA